MNNYLVVTIKDWQIEQFKQTTPKLAGNWYLITDPEELTLEKLRAISPRYIFFPHWSCLVPEQILTEFECVCFHMTDVPYGRGGSPLQNLIIRGHKETKLSALKMEKTLDTGPVYLKVPLQLNGTAQEIFVESAKLSFEMIKTIIELNPTPIAQTGEVVEFKRRRPQDSELPQQTDIHAWYDIIRMLDAESYPKAFIDHGNFKLTFSQAELSCNNELNAKIKVTPRDK